MLIGPIDFGVGSAYQDYLEQTMADDMNDSASGSTNSHKTFGDWLTSQASGSKWKDYWDVNKVAQDLITSGAPQTGGSSAKSNSEALDIMKALAGIDSSWNEKYLDSLFNAEQAQAERDYLTEMSNTAHQREMADLKAAGINPILTATGGSGASTSASPIANAGSFSPSDLNVSQSLGVMGNIVKLVGSILAIFGLKKIIK